jgi:hypothetical protein
MIKRLIPAAILAALVLAGCGSTSSTPGADPAASPRLTTHAPSSPAASATASSSAVPSSAAAATVTDGSGDKLLMFVDFEAPEPLTRLNPSEVSTCEEGGTNPFQYEPSRSVAIRVDIEAEITSSLSSPLGISLDGSHLLTSGGGVESNGNEPMWAAVTDGAATCSSSGGIVGLTWSNLEAGVSSGWSGWLILPAAITPDDPTGARVARQVIMLLPVVNFGMNDATWHTSKHWPSTNLVKCSGVMPPTVIAVSPKTALAHGCTR